MLKVLEIRWYIFATINFCLSLLRNGVFLLSNPTKIICRKSKNVRKITIRIANLNHLAPPPLLRPQIRRHFLLTVSSYLDKTHAFMALMSKKPLLCNSTITNCCFEVNTTNELPKRSKIVFKRSIVITFIKKCYIYSATN